MFEQEVAQREAQKQQQQMQNLGMTSPLPYDSLGYNAPHHPFAGYPPGYPMQAYVDRSLAFSTSFTSLSNIYMVLTLLCGNHCSERLICGLKATPATGTTILIPILQRRKPRHREVKSLSW